MTANKRAFCEKCGRMVLVDEEGKRLYHEVLIGSGNFEGYVCPGTQVVFWGKGG